MVDQVQTKGIQVEASLFHFSLTKLLVMKDLEKKENSWQKFLVSSGWVAQYSNSQKTKKVTHSVVIKEASSTVATSVNKNLTKIKLVGKKSSKKLQFSPEV